VGSPSNLSIKGIPPHQLHKLWQRKDTFWRAVSFLGFISVSTFLFNPSAREEANIRKSKELISERIITIWNHFILKIKIFNPKWLKNVIFKLYWNQIWKKIFILSTNVDPSLLLTIVNNRTSNNDLKHQQ